jgi:hypothetical protein
VTQNVARWRCRHSSCCCGRRAWMWLGTSWPRPHCKAACFCSTSRPLASHQTRLCKHTYRHCSRRCPRRHLSSAGRFATALARSSSAILEYLGQAHFESSSSSLSPMHISMLPSARNCSTLSLNSSSTTLNTHTRRINHVGQITSTSTLAAYLKQYILFGSVRLKIS